MRNLFARLTFVVALFFGLATSLTAQDTSTAIVNGVVADASGAVVPDATVVLTNPSRGLEYKTKTNSAGSYRFVNIPAGPGFQLEVSREGFATTSVKGMYLNVNNSRTQNVSLAAGTNVEVQVSAASQEVTINTENATVGNNFQVEQLNDLPIQSRNGVGALFTLQPGVGTSNSVTGARVDQNNVTVDGLDVNDFATGSAFATIGNAPVDAIQEFRGTTAGFGVSSGPGSGGQFQLISRSGTNQFHGNLFLYHRDRSTVANDWFNNNSKVARPQLIRNQFGGTLGGPILHDKLFFFGNVLFQRIAQSSPVARTVPLSTYRNGIIQYINNNAGCTSASRQNTTPTCISQYTPAQVQNLDPAAGKPGENLALRTFFNDAYPLPNDLTGGDGINTGLFRFNALLPDNESDYWLKLDYAVTSKIKVYGRGSVVRRDAVQTSQSFPSRPVLTAPFSNRSSAWVVGVDWQIASNKFNHFNIGQTVTDYAFPVTVNPQGATPITTAILTDAYKTPVNAQARRVPIPVVSDDFTWTKGRHSISVGGSFKWIHSVSNTKLDYATETVGLGGKALTLNASLRPSDILANSTANTRWDNAFAIALGRIGAINGKVNYDNTGKPLPFGTGTQRDYQYYQSEFYIGDTWKVTPSLTLSAGVNYQYYSVPYEINGLQTVADFTFDKYLAARVAQSAAGQSGNTAVPFITYTLGGPKNKGLSYYEPDYKNFAPRLAFAYNPEFDRKMVWNGSIGMVYDRTVTNAVQYQQDQYSYVFQQPLVISNGVAADPVASLAGDPRYGTNFAIPVPAAPSTPYTPYVTGTTPGGLINGSAFNSMISRDLKTPYSIMTTFGMQRELPAHFVLKANYVGRFGRRLLGQADANQLIDFTDPASGQKLGDAFAAMTLFTRNNPNANFKNSPAQPFFENQLSFATPAGYANKTSYVNYQYGSLVSIGDFADTIQGFSSYLKPNVGMAAQFSENTVYTNKGNSNYHGLLVSLQKNTSHGLRFDFNYTWQHSIDNVSLIANQGAAGGYGFVCDPLRPRLCRGESDFDIKHLVNGDFTYELPLGRGRAFGNRVPRALDYVIGGWDVSGIAIWRSGGVYSTSTGAFVPGYSNNVPGIFNGNTAAIRQKINKNSASQLFLYADPAAAAGAFQGPVGFQIGSRNNLRGPHYGNLDAGLAKTFVILRERDLKFQLRGDAFNVLNHPNFAAPANNSAQGNVFTPGSFGQLTSMNGSPRVVQVSGRITF